MFELFSVRRVFPVRRLDDRGHVAVCLPGLQVPERRRGQEEGREHRQPGPGLDADGRQKTTTSQRLKKDL